MDSSRAASISRSLLAREALNIVSVNHPRGLFSFAIDAYVLNAELSAALTASFRGVRLAYRLARPYKGCIPDRLLLAEYKALYTTHLILWSLSADATARLSTFTHSMDPTAFAAFELDIKLHQKLER
jgi:amino acid transporter